MYINDFRKLVLWNMRQRDRLDGVDYTVPLTLNKKLVDDAFGVCCDKYNAEGLDEEEEFDRIARVAAENMSYELVILWLKNDVKVLEDRVEVLEHQVEELGGVVE